MSRTCTIYRLVDPRYDEVRYVGASINIKQRKAQLKQSQFYGKRIYEWVRELRECGTAPRFEIIEECSPQRVNEREHYWIGYYLKCRQRLLNTDGVIRHYGHRKWAYN